MNQSETLDERWREVVDECRRRGLSIRDVEQDGAVLILEPDGVVDLPEAPTLREIAEAIDVEGVRFVTLALDGYATGGGDG